MTPDEKPETPAPARAAQTGKLTPPPASAPGATADLSAHMLRRGKLPVGPEPEEQPEKDEQA